METEFWPGEYRFLFRRSWTDYMGTILCMLGVGACLFLRNWDYLASLAGRSLKKGALDFQR